MRLTIDDNQIHAGRTTRERIDPAHVAAVLIVRGRHPIIARVLAWGGWVAALNISTDDAKQAGCDIGLFS